MGTVIYLGNRVQRKTPAQPQHPSDSKDDVSRIGSCAFCQKRAQLHLELCESCRRYSGDTVGQAMRRVRQNPIFARACYMAMSRESEQAKFIQAFGLPPGCNPPGLKIVDDVPSLDQLVKQYDSLLSPKNE